MSDNVHYLKGLAKVKENQIDQAVDLFTKAIEEDDSNPFFYNQRAVCYLNQENFDLALFDMNRSIELNENYAYFYSCRGFLKARIKDFDGAIHDYEKSLTLDPTNEITYNNMGVALESMGKFKKAQAYFDQSNKILGYDPSKRDLSQLDKDKQTSQKEKELTDEQNESRKDVAKKVFTNKSTFKEFLGFIGSGFKLKDKNDQG
jgi:Flp pilus assembly protein TadD